MKLFDVIQNLDKLSDDKIICARKPWGPNVECEVVLPDEDLGVPEEIKKVGLNYFLEVHLAKEALEVFGKRKPTPNEKFKLLIHYAEHDAFPDWVYGAGL